MKYRIIEEYGLYFIQYKDRWLFCWKYVKAKSGANLGFIKQENAIAKCKQIIDKMGRGE